MWEKQNIIKSLIDKTTGIQPPNVDKGNMSESHRWRENNPPERRNTQELEGGEEKESENKESRENFSRQCAKGSKKTNVGITRGF